MEHTYARSLARFAAKLGPIGWEIAAKRIEYVLPRGTKFGRGWVGKKDASQPSQLPLVSISPHSFQPENTLSTSASVSENAVDDTANEVKARSTPSATPSSLPCRSPPDSAEYSTRDRESSSKQQSAVGFHGIWQKVANQRPRVGAMQPPLNGFNHLSHPGRTLNASSPPGNFSSEAMVMHSRAPSNMLTINSIQPSTSNTTVNSAADPNMSSSYLPDDSHGCQGTREAVTMPRPVSFPRNPKVGFQSTGSPVSGALLDSQNPNPNLALGL